jgi:hypothetical protein
MGTQVKIANIAGCRIGARLNLYQSTILQKFADSIVAYWPMQQDTLIQNDVKNNLIATFGTNTIFKQNGVLGRKTALVKKAETINLKSAPFSSLMNYSEGTISVWIDPKNIKDVVSLQNLVYFYINDTNRICIQKNVYSVSYEAVNIYYQGNNINSGAAYYNFFKNSLLNITLTYSVSGDYLRLYLDGSRVAETVITSAIVGASMWITSIYAPEDCNYADLVVLNKPATDSEVLTLANCKVNVIFEGDSRTTEPKRVWSTIFDTLDKKYKYKVNSVSGTNVAALTARGDAVDAMIVTGMPNILNLLIGVNNSADDVTSIFNGVKAYCLARRVAGYRINLCTEIDSTVAGWTAKSIALNNLYKADTSFYDTLSDLRADVRLQDATNVTYFIDGTHQTKLGEQIIGSIIAPKIRALS